MAKTTIGPPSLDDVVESSRASLFPEPETDAAARMLSLLENILSSNTDLRFIRRDMRILAKARGEFATADWLERIYHLLNSKLPVIGGDGTAKEFGEWHRAAQNEATLVEKLREDWPRFTKKSMKDMDDLRKAIAALDQKVQTSERPARPIIAPPQHMPLAAAAPEVQSKHSVETDREAAEVQALAEVAQQANPELAVEVQAELNDRRIVNAVEGVKSEVAALSRAIAKRVPLNPDAAAVPPPPTASTPTPAVVAPAAPVPEAVAPAATPVTAPTTIVQNGTPESPFQTKESPLQALKRKIFERIAPATAQPAPVSSAPAQESAAPPALADVPDWWLKLSAKEQDQHLAADPTLNLPKTSEQLPIGAENNAGKGPRYRPAIGDIPDWWLNMSAKEQKRHHQENPDSNLPRTSFQLPVGGSPGAEVKTHYRNAEGVGNLLAGRKRTNAQPNLPETQEAPPAVVPPPVPAVPTPPAAAPVPAPAEVPVAAATPQPPHAPTPAQPTPETPVATPEPASNPNEAATAKTEAKREARADAAEKRKYKLTEAAQRRKEELDQVNQRAAQHRKDYRDMLAAQEAAKLQKKMLAAQQAQAQANQPSLLGSAVEAAGDLLGGKKYRYAGRTAGTVAETAGAARTGGLLARAAPYVGTAGKLVAGGAVLAAGGALIDSGFGALGVGKAPVDTKQDDANWEKMSLGEKMSSGLARGIEGGGRLLFMDNLANAAAADRIANETKYLADRTPHASVAPAKVDNAPAAAQTPMAGAMTFSKNWQPLVAAGSSIGSLDADKIKAQRLAGTELGVYNQQQKALAASLEASHGELKSPDYLLRMPYLEKQGSGLPASPDVVKTAAAALPGQANFIKAAGTAVQADVSALAVIPDKLDASLSAVEKHAKRQADSTVQTNTEVSSLNKSFFDKAKDWFSDTFPKLSGALAAGANAVGNTLASAGRGVTNTAEAVKTGVQTAADVATGARDIAGSSKGGVIDRTVAAAKEGWSAANGTMGGRTAINAFTEKEESGAARYSALNMNDVKNVAYGNIQFNSKYGNFQKVMQKYLETGDKSSANYQKIASAKDILMNNDVAAMRSDKDLQAALKGAGKEQAMQDAQNSVGYTEYGNKAGELMKRIGAKSVAASQVVFDNVVQGKADKVLAQTKKELGGVIGEVGLDGKVITENKFLDRTVEVRRKELLGSNKQAAASANPRMDKLKKIANDEGLLNLQYDPKAQDVKRDANGNLVTVAGTTVAPESVAGITRKDGTGVRQEGFATAKSVDPARQMAGIGQNLVQNANDVMYKEMQNSLGTAYKYGAKNSKTGAIDCSGYVAQLNTTTMDAMNTAMGQPVFSKQDKALLQTSSSEQIRGIGKATGKEYSKEELMAPGGIKEGMIIGEDHKNAKSDQLNGGKNYGGIDHIVQAVRNPETGELEITQASSGKGVSTMPLEQWKKSREAAGIGLRGVDPLLLAKGTDPETLRAVARKPADGTATPTTATTPGTAQPATAGTTPAKTDTKVADASTGGKPVPATTAAQPTATQASATKTATTAPVAAATPATAPSTPAAQPATAPSTPTATASATPAVAPTGTAPASTTTAAAPATATQTQPTGTKTATLAPKATPVTDWSRGNPAQQAAAKESVRRAVTLTPPKAPTAPTAPEVDADTARMMDDMYKELGAIPGVTTANGQPVAGAAPSQTASATPSISAMATTTGGNTTLSTPFGQFPQAVLQAAGINIDPQKYVARAAKVGSLLEKYGGSTGAAIGAPLKNAPNWLQGLPSIAGSVPPQVGQALGALNTVAGKLPAGLTTGLPDGLTAGMTPGFNPNAGVAGTTPSSVPGLGTGTTSAALGSLPTLAQQALGQSRYAPLVQQALGAAPAITSGVSSAFSKVSGWMGSSSPAQPQANYPTVTANSTAPATTTDVGAVPIRPMSEATGQALLDSQVTPAPMASTEPPLPSSAKSPMGGTVTIDDFKLTVNAAYETLLLGRG